MGWQDDIQATPLSPTEEKSYQKWRGSLPSRLQYEGDYDLRGFWKKNPSFSVNVPGQHMTDEFKLPNHSTFSDESKYYNQNTSYLGGHWNGDTYKPNDIRFKDPVDESNTRTQSMNGNFDPRTLRPSTTGRSSTTLADMFSNEAPNDRGEHDMLMRYLTQPRHDAGPGARRAEAGMFQGPRENDQSPSGMQQSPMLARLMAHLFGGGR